MKELSIEEKAKRYGRIMNRAKKELGACGSQDCDAARQIFRLFPELKESEDEKIRKAIIEHFAGSHSSTYPYKGFTKEQILAWLEKQGEQKSIEYPLCKTVKDKIDYYIVNHFTTDTVVKTDVNSIVKAMEEGIMIGMSEQKHANKVEPKFKVGDWITDGYLHYKVIDIMEDLYIVDTKFVKRSAILFEYENRYHLWTIQDAKDGDVLYDGSDACLFRKKIEDDDAIWVDTYCGINSDGVFDVNDEDECWCPACDCFPATKEQRDLLFQKMYDAGYEWDAEKKELKKIEQNHVIEMKTPEESLDIDSDTYNKIVDECVYGEQKPAWSDEDEKTLDNILSDLRQGAIPDDEDTNWLQNIKYRVQLKQEWSDEEHQERLKKLADKLQELRPQTTWKPSEEHYELEEFAKIVRGNLTGISKAVQKLFEAKYLQLTGNKMYGGFKD